MSSSAVLSAHWRRIKMASSLATASLLLGCLLVDAATAGTLSPVLNCNAKEAGKYQKVEFTIQIPASYTNCFDPDEVDLSLELAVPGGQTTTIPAFWFHPYERKRVGGRDWLYPSGMPHWQARFAPQHLGEHQAIAVLKIPRGSAKSQPVRFTCVSSISRGFVRVSTRDPRFLEFSEGQPFFAIGQNLAFIGSQQYVTLSKAEQIFRELEENGANYLRVWTCCEDWAMAIESRKSAFGRSWDWRPPVAPYPEPEPNGRKCLKLSAETSTIRVDPSHPLATKPSTAYLLSGQVKLEAGVTLSLELNGGKFDIPAPAAGEAVGSPGWLKFHQPFQTAADQFWLQPITLRTVGPGAAWLTELSLREQGGGPELLWEADVNRAVRGWYNPLDSFMLDELIAGAEKHGIYLQLCYLTRDVYMSALKDAASPEYDRAIKDAQKALRYAVARWGYSTSVAAWEYWNELDPGLPTDRFYAALGAYLQQVDPFRHLRTTSTWGPSPKDCRHSSLDLADVHFYLRPSDRGRLENEVEAVLERTRWLRDQTPSKPVHLGEFGIANEKWQPTEEMNSSREIVDFHNALWASSLSGACGTALFWWWDRLDKRNPYSHYRPLSRFLAQIPWTSGELQPAAASCSPPRVRPLGLQSRDRAWLWLFDRESAWQKNVVEGRTAGPITNTVVRLAGLPQATYQIQWYDTRRGNIVGQQSAAVENRMLEIEAPVFKHDLACTVRPE